MARRNRESLLDDETMQELRSDQLSGASNDCESDKSNNDDDDDDDDFGPSTSQRGRKRTRLEVSDSDVNIDDDGDDVDDGCSRNDDIRNLGQFLDSTSLTFTPDDPILPVFQK
jgi:hypothetical protein